MTPVLVFEMGGFVYVYRDLVEAGASIEAMDVEEGFYFAAYTAVGERLQMVPGELAVEFLPTSEFDLEGLETALQESKHPESASDPLAWARRNLDNL